MWSLGRSQYCWNVQGRLWRSELPCGKGEGREHGWVSRRRRRDIERSVRGRVRRRDLLGPIKVDLRVGGGRGVGVGCVGIAEHGGVLEERGSGSSSVHGCESTRARLYSCTKHRGIQTFARRTSAVERSASAKRLLVEVRRIPVLRPNISCTGDARAMFGGRYQT